MLARCYNPNSDNYSRYGGKGVTVDAVWLYETGFQRFYADMGPRPAGTSLDKDTLIQGNMIYGPGRCIWATLEQQAAARRDVTTFRIGEEVVSARRWAIHHGVSPYTLRGWVNRYGWHEAVFMTLQRAAAR